MSQSPELDARCEYALYKVLGESNSYRAHVALDSAEECGRIAYPSSEVSAFFIDEPALLEAFRRGWSAAAAASSPRTAEELKALITEMDGRAYSGCGQFYELYAQRFTSSVDGWIRALRPGELPIVQELLKTTAYEPDAGGHWAYCAEENDIYFVAAEK